MAITVVEVVGLLAVCVYALVSLQFGIDEEQTKLQTEPGCELRARGLADLTPDLPHSLHTARHTHTLTQASCSLDTAPVDILSAFAG